MSDGTFLTGLLVVERLTEVLSSVSVSDLMDVVPRCFDFLVLFIRADFRLGLASFALSDSESDAEEAADDESVVVDEADEASFLITSGFGFSEITFGAGRGVALGNGYFRGLPRPREVELPDCLRFSLIGLIGGDGFSSSDSDEFEKILLSFFDFDCDGGGGFLGDGRLFEFPALLAEVDDFAVDCGLLCCCMA